MAEEAEQGPRISVDDSALLEASCQPGATRGRSRSPSSLELCSHRLGSGKDRLSPAALKGCPLQKCLSFPRLQSGEGAAARLLAAEQDFDDVSMVGHAGLLRSMSARTVDSLPQHMTHSLGSSESGSRFLSPCSACADNMGTRSTSCPQMTLTVLAGKPDAAVSGAYLGHSPCEEPDLAGEVIKDLPVAPAANFPDLIPERKTSLPDRQNANMPSSGTSGMPPDVTCHQQARKSSGHQGTLVERTGPDPLAHKSRDGNYNVDAREKCLRWLKSISIDAGQ